MKLIGMAILLLNIGGSRSLADQNQCNGDRLGSAFKFSKSLTINNFDSLIFDLNSAASGPVYTDVPLYISSDDSVFAVDFALQFDLIKLEFDSIYSLTGNLQYLYHYNANDSTLRFTSNSLSLIESNMPLLMLRFRTNGYQMCAGDIFNLTGWLNGDVCAAASRNCVTTGVADIEPVVPVKLYPNPVYGMLTIHSFLCQEILIADVNGRVILKEVIPDNDTNHQIDMGALVPGVYSVTIFAGRQTYTSKIVKL